MIRSRSAARKPRARAAVVAASLEVLETRRMLTGVLAPQTPDAFGSPDGYFHFDTGDRQRLEYTFDDDVQ